MLSFYIDLPVAFYINFMMCRSVVEMHVDVFQQSCELHYSELTNITLQKHRHAVFQTLKSKRLRTCPCY